MNELFSLEIDSAWATKVLESSHDFNWQKWLDLGLPYAVSITKALVVLTVGLIVVKIVEGVLHRLFSKTELDETLEIFFVKVAQVTGKLFVFVIALSALGVDVGPIVAGIGVAGFVVGFALKDTLSNVSAGVMLLIYRPFSVKERVNLAGKEGVVTAIDVPATMLVDDDGNTIMVPNSKVWGNVMINYSRKEVVPGKEVVEVAGEEKVEEAKEEKKKDKKEEKADEKKGKADKKKKKGKADKKK